MKTFSMLIFVSSSIHFDFFLISVIKNDAKCIEQFQALIDMLPTCNRLLLSWMIVHMTHIIKRVGRFESFVQFLSLLSLFLSLPFGRYLSDPWLLLLEGRWVRVNMCHQWVLLYFISCSILEIINCCC